MKMAKRVVLILAFVLGVSGVVAAQGPPPSPAPPPATERPAFSMGARPVMIGPQDMVAPVREVSGKLTVVANVARDVQPASVEFLIDEKPAGSAAARPYIAEFDTTGTPDGEHTFKAVGKDADGKQIWTAITKVRVNNTDPAPAQLRGTRNRGDRGPVAQPGGPPAGASGFAPMEPGPSVPPEDVPAPAAASPPPSTPLALDKTYTSAGRGFSVSYPGSWTVTDLTGSKEKNAGGFWIAFGAPPVDKAPMVVNLHRQKLSPTTDADTFVKYNDYVTTWERKTVDGNTAFRTTTGSAQSRNVIHRMIILTKGSAWMFNLVDKSGNPASGSGSLFESIVGTFRPLPK